MARTIGSNWLWLLLLLIGCAVLDLLEAAAIGSSSEGIPANPVAYKRWVRRRPSPHDPNLSVYEVRHVYFVRRSTTPKPKPVIELDDEEMDRRIRCDFQPSLAECGPISSTTTATTTTPPPSTTTTTTLTTPASSITTTTTPPPPSTTTSTTPATTSTSTTTDLPFLPLLPERESTTTITTSEPSNDIENTTDDNYILSPEDDYADGDNDDDDDQEDDDNDVGYVDEFAKERSIGINDPGFNPEI